MRYLEDLRFVIGLFFLILSIALFAVSATSYMPNADAMQLNVTSASLMGIFGVVMLWFSLYWPQQATND